jgi:hypothetical protein
MAVKFSAGRLCAAYHCSTILSIYNPDSLCAKHDRAMIDAALPTAKSSPVRPEGSQPDS